MKQSAPPSPISPETDIDFSSVSRKDLPGQYKYNNFDEVLE
jgi:hypothetical protein